MAVYRHSESCVSCIRHMRCWLKCVVSPVVVMVSPRCRCLPRVTALPRTTGRYGTCCDELGETRLAIHSTAAGREGTEESSSQKCQMTLHPGCQVKKDSRSNMSWQTDLGERGEKNQNDGTRYQWYVQGTNITGIGTKRSTNRDRYIRDAR
jgi:hypothetical protein